MLLSCSGPLLFLQQSLIHLLKWRGANYPLCLSLYNIFIHFSPASWKSGEED